MSFNDYWKEKAAKRRKSWAGKAQRFAEQYTQLESIRKVVYLPLDYAVGFDFEDYKLDHFVKKNPIICWHELSLWFVEDGLRAALEAEGADMESYAVWWIRQSMIQAIESKKGK